MFLIECYTLKCNIRIDLEVEHALLCLFIFIPIPKNAHLISRFGKRKLFCFHELLEIKPRALYMLGKISATYPVFFLFCDRGTLHCQVNHEHNL